MNTPSAATRSFAETLTASASALPGLAWIKPLRTAALHRFEQAGFPTTRQEDWRYTDLREYADRTQRLALVAAPAVDDTLPRALTGRLLASQGMGIVAVFRSGMLVDGLSQLQPPAGMTCTRPGAGDATAAWEANLSHDTRDDSDALASLNVALLGDGLAAEVAPGISVAQPLYVACTTEPGRTAQNRLVLRLRAGSSCTLIEHHLGSGPGVANSVTDIICERDARLTYIRLQDEADEAFHLTLQRIRLEAGAEASLLGVDLGGRLIRNTLRVDLAGPGSAADIHGLFFADGQRHIDNQTRVDHRALHTRSREKYRGIIDGSGRGIFNGKIIVHSGADKTDAQLRNENLLLSAGAEIDTKPELEIYADDVKCAHGATTGQLDAASIFYLRSRGVGAEDARRMLVAAFAGEIIHAIPVAGIQQHLVDALGTRLPDLAAVGSRP